MNPWLDGTDECETYDAETYYKTDRWEEFDEFTRSCWRLQQACDLVYNIGPGQEVEGLYEES